MRIIVKEMPNSGDKRVQTLVEAFNLHPIVARMMVQRGIDDPGHAKMFLCPSWEDIVLPERIPSIVQAVAKIKQVMSLGQPIVVYGDYDVDGITATAVLVDALTGLGAKVTHYIPSRHLEGYGLNADAVNSLASEGCKLIITVDNGIVANDEIALAQSLGMDCIVTDHHLPSDSLPPCICINSRLSDWQGGSLCGAGVAWKLGFALRDEAWARHWLCPVALATVADMVPLIGENRSIVFMGLKRHHIEQHPGLLMLAQMADMRKNRPWNEVTFAYMLGPRINAAGRIKLAEVALHLLLSKSAGEAKPYAEELNQNNIQRRQEESETLQSALEYVQSTQTVFEKYSLAIGENWNEGVVGLVASRLVERFSRPAIVFTQKSDEGVLVGSCRSVNGVDIHACLSQASHLFVRFGGHTMAAGVTMKEEHLQAFRAHLNEWFLQVPTKHLIPSVEVDAEIDLDDCTAEFTNQINCLAPFGVGNPSPLFMLSQARLSGMTPLSQGAHSRFFVNDDDGKSFLMVAFRQSPREIVPHAYYDLVFMLENNAYAEQLRTQGVVRTMQISNKQQAVCKSINAKEIYFKENFWSWFVKHYGGYYEAAHRLGIEEALRNPFGKVYCASTTDAAHAIVSMLDQHQILSELPIRFGRLSPLDVRSGAVLFAPSPDALDIVPDDQIVWFGMPPLPRFASVLVPEQSRVWLTQTRWNREMMARYWNQLKLAINKPYRDILSMLNGQQATPEMYVALCVFFEVSLFVWKDHELGGCLDYGQRANQGKIDLEESNLFQSLVALG